MTHFTILQNELTKLRAKWEAEFPGTTAVIELLRESLIASEAVAMHSRSAFQQFHVAAESTSLPLGLWHPKFLAQFNHLKRQQSQDMRHCLHVLQSLQTASAQFQAAEAKKPPPPPPPKLPNKVTLEQIIDVTIVDGEVITETTRTAAFWCEKQVWDAAYFNRRFHFHDAVVPPPYSYALAHDGNTIPPVRHITISYSPAEFKRLCELELSTGSAYLLDGDRLAYHWRE